MSKRTIIISITLGIILLFTWRWLTIDKSKSHPIYSERISGQKIYKEKYETYYGGSLNGNNYSYYVTDSTHFRKFIGPCEDSEFFAFQVRNDSIIAIKRAFTFGGGSRGLDSSFFSIKALKKEGKFE